MDPNKNLNIEKEIKGLNKIEKIYENMTYFSEYGFTFFVFICITFLILLGCIFCYLMIHSQAIRDDWVNSRCHPYVIPFAGLINKPKDMSIIEYTQQNYDYCNQTILETISGEALQPLTYVTKLLTNVTNDILKAIQNIRAMFDKTRTNIQDMSKDLMSRLLNIMAPLQEIFIGFKDVISKMEGILTATLYTFIGTYYTLQSLMGTIVNFIINILIALAVLIVSLWIVPFTWPAAASMTAIFIAISIPMTLIVIFMIDVLHIKPDKSIPGIPSKPKPHCFDENTKIEMNDGTLKPILEIQVGDLLKNKNKVTAKLKLIRNTNQLYDLNGVIVSGSHVVFHEKRKDWVYVCNHDDAKLLSSYENPYLYCLNTSQKKIEIKDMIFVDWDEIIHLKENKDVLKKYLQKHFIPNYSSNFDENIHRYLDGGLVGNTQIQLFNGKIKEMKFVEIGDILEKGEKVVGLVEIDGITLEEQYVYSYGSSSFEGGPNLIIQTKNDNFTTIELNEHKKHHIIDLHDENCLIKKRKKERKEEKLYHFITDKLTFSVENLSIYSYNSCIDFILEI